MPELPEVQAHAERLTDLCAGAVLQRFVPLNFTALKTAVPEPAAAYGRPLLDVGRRGKYLLLRFAPVTFVVHLMQGGRLLVDVKQSAKPRTGQARFVFQGSLDGWFRAYDSATGKIVWEHSTTAQTYDTVNGIKGHPVGGIDGMATTVANGMVYTMSGNNGAARIGSNGVNVLLAYSVDGK